MPNWCSNSINITGDNEDIKKLLIEAKSDESDFTLNNLVPIPKEAEEDWYNWRVENWGTKWDIGKVELDVNDGYINFNCETAWAPPNEALRKISEKYPTLSFEIFFEEPGMDFCGKCVFQEGETVEDISATYSECFGTNLTFDMSQATINDERMVVVPIIFSKKSDPYDFDEEMVNRNGILKFSENLEPDDFEESLSNSDFVFEFENSEDKDAVDTA